MSDKPRMVDVRPVVLCGGSGTRLWPLSRTGFPKQFLALTGSETLFQQAARRLTLLNTAKVNLLPLYVVSNEAHRFLVQEQLREIGVKGIFLLEPVGRNTAPALTLAALAAMQNGDDPVLVVVPADQTIADDNAFVQTVEEAIDAASAGEIAVLGIKPDRPATGYGYIKIKSALDGRPAAQVRSFVEKPDHEKAAQYLREGGFFWNAGIFVVKASVWMKALQRFRPDIANATQEAWRGRIEDGSFVRPERELFEQIPAESVDYAVLEHCPGTVPLSMVTMDAGWSDLGAWDAVWSVLGKDDDGNAFYGDILNAGSVNTLVHATNRLVSLVGVSNLVVIETPDAVLVADKSQSQNVKEIVNQLNGMDRDERDLHRKVYRPWGWYDSIDEGDRFKVKRIQVNPGASLSLQKHRHRAEHWIVVKGAAEITCGGKVVQLHENQSTYIPVGELHRLSNPGQNILEIIEVQSGDYLGEDDIVRIEDNYGRG